MRKCFVLFACGLLSAAVCGCSGDSTSTATSPEGSAAVDGSQYLLSEAPAGAEEVIRVRESAQNDDPVVLVGRIGGSKDPWIKGRAAFSLVDRSLKACSDVPGDSCPMPWDYCCVTDQLPKATVLVKVVDSSGSPVKADARELLGVKELSSVIVKGQAKRDEAGNVTVLASAIYVEK